MSVGSQEGAEIGRRGSGKRYCQWDRIRTGWSARVRRAKRTRGENE
jgi:hypothetical protein